MCAVVPAMCLLCFVLWDDEAVGMANLLLEADGRGDFNLWA